MNYKTFNAKEHLFYRFPTIVIDIIIYLLVFKALVGSFVMENEADYALYGKTAMVCLVMGYLISIVVFPIQLYQRGWRIRSIATRVFCQVALAMMTYAFLVFFIKNSFAGRFYLRQAIYTFIAVVVWHLLFKYIINLVRKNGKNKVHVVIVGKSQNDIVLYNKFIDNDGFNEYKVLGLFTDNAEIISNKINHLGDLGQLGYYLKNHQVHELYCGLDPAEYGEKTKEIIRLCEDLFIDFYFVPEFKGYPNRRMSIYEVGTVNVIKFREIPLGNPINRMLKRSLDVFFSGLLLVTIFPIVYIITFIGTKLSSPGPVFFVQERTGYEGRSFKMIKFRSMRVNALSDSLQATKDDPRKTKFGDFLRRSSIDELPQLINIFIGDMSFIGPRPHMINHTSEYKKLIDEYLVRHSVKPGLTGWAQVTGFRGETNTLDQMEGRVLKDIWYIENWSLWLDAQIVLKTIVHLIGGDKQAY